MNLLTNGSATELEQINKALENERVKQISDSEIVRLGEGAWHYAYLINIEADPYVLRIPKKVAYEKQVEYNYDELMADYAGTQAYYKHANRVKEGMCPEHYSFYVSKDLTYTLESFVGKSIPLRKQTLPQAEQYGAEVGDFFRTLEHVDPPISGLGYLKWTGERVVGQFDMDVQSFIQQETEEYQKELEDLLSCPIILKKDQVRQIGNELLSRRLIEGERLIFTNQDTSPENLIFTENRVHIIDPYPTLYTGTSLAANFAFNYQTTFPTFYNTKRYRKQKYNLTNPQLQMMADGFIKGYVQGSPAKQDALHVEVFIKLLTMTHTHMELLQSDMLNPEQEIRYGSKAEIENRLKVLVRQLENYQIEHKKQL